MTTTAVAEQKLIDSVRLDDAWSLVEQFSRLVRESGSEQEREAVNLITSRLQRWGIPFRVYEPELLVSLPRRASLTVNGEEYKAKTPSMVPSTGPDGARAGIVYEPTGFAKSADDIFKPATRGTADVRGQFVMCEGQPMGGKVRELEERGAVGVIFIAPGERIHEGIVTTIWGSPDLTNWRWMPRIPAISIARPDGERIIAELSKGSVSATMVADHDTGWRKLPIIVSQVDGNVEPERFVLVHGHIDSWHVGVGDNATGDATLLEVARAVNENRADLARSVRVCWWSGHSHGRYAGSAWYADAFALELEDNCICHINCDSPGCRDADAFEHVMLMAEAQGLAEGAIRDFVGAESNGAPPVRGGDLSFSNIGLSTFFMLTSHMSDAELRRRGYYGVGGCGGNLEWHHEDDTIEVADKKNLLRDMRLYAGAAYRVANAILYPLDYRATLDQIETALGQYKSTLDGLADFDALSRLLAETRRSLDTFYERAGRARSIQEARPFNDAILHIGRALVPVVYARLGRFRQDPADHIPLVPEFGDAAAARGTVPDGVLRIELLRAGNRLRRALVDTQQYARAAGA